MNVARKLPANTESALALPPGFEVTAVGLKVHGRPSFEKWLSIMKGLQGAHRLMLWVLGDGFVYGEGAFGELFAQAIEEHSAETARNAMWVSSRIEFVRRLTNLSWSHHQVVASLEPKEQDRFLAVAAEKKLSVGELRRAVREFKLLLEPEPVTDWHERPEPPEAIDLSAEEPEEYDMTPEHVDSDIRPTARATVESDFRHLLQLVKAYLTAERGNLARGIKPDPEDALRLRAALELFIAEHDR
jgi:hypothetical protein